MRRSRRGRDRKKDLIIRVLLVILILESFFIFFLLKRKPIEIVKPAKIKKAKIAIVIDDWGYNQRNLKFIKEVKFPVNISILPFLPYSTKIANEAKLNNQEIIVHLPLEPHQYRKVNVEQKVILTSMNKDKISKIINDALKSVPNAKGISNHMGSKATEDEDLMRVIFSEMKKHKFYFLDSYVTPKTVCPEVSKDIRINFAKRSVFLDNEADPNYIHNQLMSLLDAASKDGEAIGIGHDRSLTLKVIREFVPKIDKNKFEIVFVSELVK